MREGFYLLQNLGNLGIFWPFMKLIFSILKVSRILLGCNRRVVVGMMRTRYHLRSRFLPALDWTLRHLTVSRGAEQPGHLVTPSQGGRLHHGPPLQVALLPGERDTVAASLVAGWLRHCPTDGNIVLHLNTVTLSYYCLLLS